METQDNIIVPLTEIRPLEDTVSRGPLHDSLKIVWSHFYPLPLPSAFQLGLYILIYGRVRAFSPAIYKSSPNISYRVSVNTRSHSPSCDREKRKEHELDAGSKEKKEGRRRERPRRGATTRG